MTSSLSILLVEARRPPGLGHTNAEAFPFVAGYAAERGLPFRWIGFPPQAWATAPTSYVLELTDQARRRLLDHLAAVRASHVLFSEVPGPALLDLVHTAGPDLRVGSCASPRSYLGLSWLVDWLGLDDDREGMLPDHVAPVYRSMTAGDLLPGAPTPLVGSAPCLYAAPLVGNAAFAGVNLAGLERQAGCTFCPVPPEARYRLRTPPLELALRQLAAVRAEPETICSRTEFVVRSAVLFHRLPELLRRLECDAESPLALYFACRADDVLAGGDGLEEALATARRCGHEIHLYSLGAENFSPAENERFNKGLSQQTLAAALTRLRAWERDFPGTFFFFPHGGLGFILFTPWTTLEDLRLNVAAARDLGLEEDAFILTRRLMLLADTPLARLAERDGLTDPGGPDDVALFAWLERFCDPGCRHFLEERDRPWRFRDPVTARVCAITVRMAKVDSLVDGDPHHARIRAAVAGARLRLLDAFSLLLRVVAARPEAPLGALVDAFVAALRATEGEQPARAPGPPAGGARP